MPPEKKKSKKQTSQPETTLTLTLTNEQGATAYKGYLTARQGDLAFVTAFEYFDETDLAVIVEDGLNELRDMLGSQDAS